MEFDNLDECINELLKKASKYACEGVIANVGGPFGAGIILKDKDKYKILVVERNNVIQKKDPTAHAEVNAIRKACRKLNTNFLENCILVTTAKSCPMCISAAIWAKIPEVYYAVDYDYAMKSGFKDKDISDYICNKNDILEEIKVKTNIAEKPFKIWNTKRDRFNY